MTNIIGYMEKIVANASTMSALPIVYQHRTNNTVTQETTTTANIEQLRNYKVSGEHISDVIKLIISKSIIDGDKVKFLNEEAKKNDTVIYNGKTFYVIETKPLDVELEIICGTSSFTQSVKQVSFRR